MNREEKTHYARKIKYCFIGYARFRKEYSGSAFGKAENSVIAPGGSAIYGKEAMDHFKEIAEIVYLKLSYRSVARRLGDLTKRGVVFRPGQTLKALYKERCPLYEKYADYVVECDGKKIGETLELVRQTMGNARGSKREIRKITCPMKKKLYK